MTAFKSTCMCTDMFILTSNNEKVVFGIYFFFPLVPLCASVCLMFDV